MGFCIGGKACARLHCKERCKSALSMYPDVERACKNACKGDSSVTPEEVLCSGKYVDQQAVMLAYGFDPCLGDNVTIGDTIDPNGDREREDQEPERWQNVIIVFAALLALAVIGLLYIKMR